MISMRPGGSDALPEGLAVLVPVKVLDNAKTRLASLLTLAERQRLAWVLLERVLGELAGLPAGLRRVVVSSYGPALERAGTLGFQIIREESQRSESDSVDHASAVLEAQGIRGVLRLPLDLPLFTAEALAPVLAAAAAGQRAVVVPSRDGTGTNALYRSPPTLFPSRFGPGSRALHEREARARTERLAVLEVPALALDIDEPEDVAELLRLGVPCPAADYLRGLGVGDRLAGGDRTGGGTASGSAR